VRLRAFLAGKLPDEQRRGATLRLAEALIAAEQYGEAHQLLASPALRDELGTSFFVAQAVAGLGRWAEALPLYERSASDPASPFRTDATFGQAEALRSLGRREEALQVFSGLVRDQRWKVRARLCSAELLLEKNDAAAARRLINSVRPRSPTERKQRRFLRASLELKGNNRERALDLFVSILKQPEGATRQVLIATLFAIADAHLQANTPGAADDFLEDFIERRPADPALPVIFAKLDQLYAAERKQTRHDLGRWSTEPAQPRRALALWYLARAELRIGRRDLALEAFARLRGQHVALPALAHAFIQSAQLHIDDGRHDEAAAALDLARSLRPAAAVLDAIDLLAGRSQYLAARFDAAAARFDAVAQRGSPLAPQALFNGSLAWLHIGDAQQLTARKEDLAERGAPGDMRGDLLLEQGLIEAAKGAKTAPASLHAFVREAPKHPRVSEAWVALAELAFHAVPSRADEARKHLARAAEAQPSPRARERADYLTIWLEDAEPNRDEAKVIALASTFLEAHPTSELLPEVRLKLAETYFRRQDFAGAQTQFEILAQRNPASPIAEKALFFAAQSAMQGMAADSLDRALVLFEDVVKTGGEFKWPARNQQALIERKLGRPDDAMTLYEEVLRGDASPAEKREALCGKGDILYEVGGANPESYRRAAQAYEQLAAEADAPAHWRNQALFKKGMCHEKLNEPAEALATFYRIVDNDGRPGKPREFFWYYKAGFNAARLLEQQSKWEPAAAIYEKLAFAGGGRSEEAKTRLNRLRLEHFLWER
ncbi:MAG TPA: tetratricopeptide repeat protein, partial [Chthoniobacterales bacterium]|nr:tetratricopeptide repeat protein [Chthoniobacterales bacterium]